MKKNIIIIILGVLVVGLGAYIVYDKVNNKTISNENVINSQNSGTVVTNDDNIIETTVTNEETTTDNNAEASEETSKGFALKTINKDATGDELDQYLMYFMPKILAPALYLPEEINDDFINQFIYYAINYLIRREKIEYTKLDNEVEAYIIDKKYIVPFIETYFDVSEYTIGFVGGRGYGIFDMGDGTYKFTYQATGWYPPAAIHAGNNSYNYVEYALIDTMSNYKYIGMYRIYLTYKDNTYKITKLQYIKNED